MKEIADRLDQKRLEASQRLAGADVWTTTRLVPSLPLSTIGVAGHKGNSSEP